MLRRLCWITASYFTRPLFLAIVILALLFALLGSLKLRNPSYTSNYPSAPTGKLLVDSRSMLELVRRERRQREVDAINLDALWRDLQPAKEIWDEASQRTTRVLSPPDEEFFRILDEFPNLRIVVVHCYGTPTGLKRIAGLPKLEYLAIDGVPRLGLSDFRSSRALRRIDLTIYGPPSGIEALVELPHLETILFQSGMAPTADVLDVIARLPHLKTLAINYPSSYAEPPLTTAGFAALAKSRSLQTLYVGGMSPNHRTELLAMVRSALPRLDVQPTIVPTTSPMPLMYAWPAAVLAAAIGMQLWSQFRGPISRVAPRYVASHALVAGLLTIAAVSVGAWRLVATTCR